MERSRWPTDVVMPQMGESIAEGTIVRWIKKVGDPVERDEPLFEISTDKVDAEIPSPAAGVLAEIRAKEGETVPVNSVVAVIGAGRRSARSAATRRPSSRRRRPRPSRQPTAPATASAAAQADGAAAADRGAAGACAVGTGSRRRAAASAAPVASASRPTPDAPDVEAIEDDSPALVAARAQDREGAQRRHLADPRHRHRRPRDQGRHPRLHRQQAAGRPTAPASRRRRAAAAAGSRPRPAQPAAGAAGRAGASRSRSSRCR